MTELAHNAAMPSLPESLRKGSSRKACSVEFPDKVRAVRKAQAARDSALQDMAQRIEALGPRPSLPPELCETFIFPDEPHVARPEREGWTVEALRDIAGGRYWDRKAGWVYLIPKGHPSRMRATELLAVRQAHDALIKAYYANSVAIEASTQSVFEEEDRCALDLMRYPASSLAEVREKIAIARDLYLFDHPAGEEARDLILEDVLAIAEAANG